MPSRLIDGNDTPAEGNKVRVPQASALFNNCRNRDHEALYSAGAFFDLYTHGGQARLLRGLRPGQLCVVASYEPSRDVRLEWFEFQRETLELPKGEDEILRVFYGNRIRTQVMTKSVAAAAPPYSALFDRLGRFKQVAAIDVR